MKNTEQIGCLIFAAVETYRTSRFAAPVIVESNQNYLRTKLKIWRHIPMVALGVAAVAAERSGLIS